MIIPSQSAFILIALSISSLLPPSAAAPALLAGSVDNSNSGWVIVDPCNNGWTVSRHHLGENDRRAENAVDFCNNGWHVTGGTVSKMQPTAALVV
ncbi:hypothetical protein V5O48_017420 [Marasmius crinis-equi]|uniref:Uncharacterized protein n=1 Tax=Marasmius crinis-equi TaxID=585013 RepID=A0ABR3EP32_9AGAR